MAVKRIRTLVFLFPVLDAWLCSAWSWTWTYETSVRISIFPTAPTNDQGLSTKERLGGQSGSLQRDSTTPTHKVNDSPITFLRRSFRVRRVRPRARRRTTEEQETNATSKRPSGKPHPSHHQGARLDPEGQSLCSRRNSTADSREHKGTFDARLKDRKTDRPTDGRTDCLHPCTVVFPRSSPKHHVTPSAIRSSGYGAS